MIKINRKDFQKLIDFDIAWLMENSPPALPKAHIVQVLKSAPDQFYGPLNKVVEDGQANPLIMGCPCTAKKTYQCGEWCFYYPPAI